MYGLPIGSALSSIIANIYIKETLKLQHSRQPKAGLRFVDDALMLWNHDKESLEKFYD